MGTALDDDEAGMSHLEPVVVLSCSPLFGDLRPSIIEAIAGLCKMSSLRAGATLFHKGDAGDSLYGIRRGQIAIEISTAGGANVTLAFLGPGDLFGEIALLDGRGRTADAVATQATELFALRRADVLGLIAREPDVGIKIIEVLCQRLRAMSVQIEQSLTQKLDARIAARLLQMAEDFGTMIAITQDQLARSVGATRESVNRQLRSWEKVGILEIRRGSIELKNLPALRLS